MNIQSVILQVGGGRLSVFCSVTVLQTERTKCEQRSIHSRNQYMYLSTTPRARAHVLLFMMVVVLVSGLLKSGLFLWASDTKRHVLEPLLALMRSCSCCIPVLQVHPSAHMCVRLGPHSRTNVNSSHPMFLTPQTDSRVFGN